MHDSYLTLAQLCPNLESLHLNLCGRLTTEAVASWGKTLKHIRRFELNGPFLVRKEGWATLFKALGKQLGGFLLTQSPRIDVESIDILVTACPNLTELRLTEIGQLDDDCLVPLSNLKKLKVLDLTSAGGDLSAAAIDRLLSTIGKSLTSLTLSDNASLGDEVLDCIAEHCPNLRHLGLRGLHDLSDDAVASFFKTLKKQSRPAMESIDLEKGDDLQGKALRALVSHSAPALQRLSLLGWRSVDADALVDLTKCSALKHLNLAWCRGVTDYSLKDVLASCEQIQTIVVWGRWFMGLSLWGQTADTIIRL